LGKEYVMKREIKIAFVLSLVVVLLGIAEVQAVDVYFYSDAVIEDGDDYRIVRVFDTLPEHTTVDMYGGSVASLRTYDSSIVNIYGGSVLAEIRIASSSTVNLLAGTINLDALFVIDSSTLNVYGGDLLVGNSPGFSDSSTVNIYGYGFNYDGFLLRGFLSDGSAFLIRECFQPDYELINLILVSEPVNADIDIHPDILNLASKGSWINCRISLPEDCNATGINPDSVLLEGRVKADSILFNEQQQTAMAKFARSELEGILEPGEVSLTVTGYLTNGTYFEGTDTIKVIDKPDNKSAK
jgi:hypothetical protein